MNNRTCVEQMAAACFSYLLNVNLNFGYTGASGQGCFPCFTLHMLHLQGEQRLV